MLNGRETKLERADRRRPPCAAAVVFELEEELMAWVNRPKAVSSGESGSRRTSTQGPPPANIFPTDLLDIATAANVEEKTPTSNVPSPPSSTTNDNISAPPVVSGALPDIQNPRVQERSNHHQGPPPANKIYSSAVAAAAASAAAAFAAAAVEEKTPTSNVPSPPSSTTNKYIISKPPIVNSALPVIRNPRVEEGSNHNNEISDNALCDAASRRQEFKPSHSVESCNGSHISRRASPKSVIAHTRSKIKVCFQLAPPLFRRQKSNESVPLAVYLGLRGFKDKSSNNISAAAAAAVEEASKRSGNNEEDFVEKHRHPNSIVLGTIEEKNVEEYDEDTRTQQQHSSLMRSSFPIWSECSVNVDDGDEYVEEAMTLDAAASYTTRGRQRRRINSPRTDSFLREEENESALHHLNNTHNSPAIHISNLPWRDRPLNGELHGQYSGPINDLLQPHGEGVLLLEGNTFLRFYGLWNDGELLTFPGCTQRLLNEDEKRDFEASTRSARILSDTKNLPPQTYGRKISTEYMNTPSASSASSELLSSAESKTSSSAEFADKSSKSTSIRQHPPKQKYTLGEVARSPSHMVIYRSKEKAIQSASRLNKYDQAFIKRSNGLW